MKKTLSILSMLLLAMVAMAHRVSITVNNADDSDMTQFAWFMETDYDQIYEGNNSVPTGAEVMVYAYAGTGRTVSVTVDGAAISLTDNLWYSDPLNADMAIVVTFNGGTTPVTPDPSEEGVITVSKSMADLVAEKNYTLSAGTNVTCYTSVPLDDVITISTTGDPYCGSFWQNTLGTDWRLYQAKNGNIIITAASGYELKSVTIDYVNSNDGELTNLPYDVKTDVTGTSVTYVVGNSSTKTNGQVRIRAITVEYKAVGAPTAVEDVMHVKAVKVMENGQVYIIRNGIRYNTAGQIVD